MIHQKLREREKKKKFHKEKKITLKNLQKQEKKHQFQVPVYYIHTQIDIYIYRELKNLPFVFSLPSSFFFYYYHLPTKHQHVCLQLHFQLVIKRHSSTMKFEPTDYLLSLNIDFDSNINNDYFDDEVSPMIDNQQLQQDLDLFSQAANDFYSLDVLGDTTIPTKQQQPPQQQQQHQQQPQQPQQQLYNSSSTTTTIVSPQFQTPIDYSQFQPQYEQNPQYAKPSTTHTPAPVYNNNNNNNNNSSIYGTNLIAAATSYSTVSTPAQAQAQAPGSTSTLVSLAEQASLLDKKKRNTAASARFRIKKKLKEQELHTKTKELEEKVERLQQKLRKMEVENKCLKTIIFKQNESKNSQLVESIKKRISEEYDLTGL